MSNFLKEFKIFSKIKSKLKRNLKLFHIFDQGQSVLLLTNSDNVIMFSLIRRNYIALNSNVEPIFIPELCNKNIKQFFIGNEFVLALNGNNQVLGFGQNGSGQLGRGSISHIYERPALVQFRNENIQKLSVGSDHCLALTSTGIVYGWGSNRYGQVGCGKQWWSSAQITRPRPIKHFTKFLIKDVYCFENKSFAITSDGLVFSWGRNKWCDLGHDLNENEGIFEPKLINISNVVSICLSSRLTYFLTNEGLVYICGQFTDQNNKDVVKTLEIIDTNIKFIHLDQVNFAQGFLDYNAIATSEQGEFFFLKSDKMIRITSEYYQTVRQFIPKTFKINKNKEIVFTKRQINFSNENRFNQRFEELSELGSGGFGTVLKVQDKCTKRLTAVKKTKLPGYFLH